MATYTKFQPFIEAVMEGKHDFSSDQLVVALTNAANPPAATDGVLGDLTEIAYTNLSSRNITTSSSSQTGGTYSLVLADLVLTASGNVAAFQYVVVYNDDAATDELIAFFDYGSEISLVSGETFTIDFNASGLFTAS